MFGLRFKRLYREYEYSRFSEEDQTTCVVYERQYNPVMEVGGFGFIGCILYHIMLWIFNYGYNFNIMLIFFITFVFIRLSTITEKDKK